MCRLVKRAVRATACDGSQALCCGLLRDAENIIIKRCAHVCATGYVRRSGSTNNEEAMRFKESRGSRRQCARARVRWTHDDAAAAAADEDDDA